HGLQLKRLDDVARLDVVKILQSDPTLEISQHLAHVILEALERADLSFPHDPAVTHQSHPRAAGDFSIHHHRTSDGAARDIENFANFDSPELLLTVGGREQSFHRFAHVVDCFVDDGVRANLDTLFLSELRGLWFGTDVKPDDDRTGGCSEGDVRLGDGP